MKKYLLEVFINEKGEIEGIHEKADSFTVHNARIMLSVFIEYQRRMLDYILTMQTMQDLQKQEAKKVE